MQFDFAAARRAAAKCRQIAHAITEGITSRQALVDLANRQWEGPTRQQFSSEYGRLTREAQAVCAELMHTAANIERAADAAQRELWRLEHLAPAGGDAALLGRAAPQLAAGS